MKIRLIKKLVKNGSIAGNTDRKWLKWNINKLNKKSYNMVKSGNLGNNWDNIQMEIEKLKQALFRI